MIPSFSSGAIGGSVSLSVANTWTAMQTFSAGTNVASGQAYKYNGVNIAYGFTALESYFFAGAGNATQTGTRNIGLGNTALAGITSGLNNLALGQQALGALTSGDANTAVGIHAMLACVTGTRNVAFGVDSLREGTGNDNTAVGHDAMIGAAGFSTGGSNVAIGKNALASFRTAGSCVAVGANAGGFLTTGGGNVAIGSQALGNCTTGVDNSAFGKESNRLGTGSGNITFGTQAGYGLTTGNNNVLIGYAPNAASYGQVTTGNQNISIGYDVAVPSPTASNQLCISNFIYGTTMSGTGSTVSTSGKLGFGVKAPDYFVHVAGPLGFAPGASLTPVNDGDVVIEFTNATTITFRGKAAGVVKSGTITLA